MVTPSEEIERKYGHAAAADFEQLLTRFRTTLAEKLSELQSSITSQLTLFRQAEMIPASDLQKMSYRSLEERLQSVGKMILLYNSAPSAVIFGLKKLEELLEQIEAQLAVLARLELNDRELSPQEFWNMVEQARPPET